MTGQASRIHHLWRKRTSGARTDLVYCNTGLSKVEAQGSIQYDVDLVHTKSTFVAMLFSDKMRAKLLMFMGAIDVHFELDTVQNLEV